jgi:hypothetical protein
MSSDELAKNSEPRRQKITRMASVSKGFPRSKNSKASKKIRKCLESALESAQPPKKLKRPVEKSNLQGQKLV